MKDKKFWQKAFNLFFLFMIVIFLMPNNSAEAKYSVGIVGIDSRTVRINLDNYTRIDDSTTSPLIYAQTTFEDVMTDELPRISNEFSGIEKTEYSRMARESEVEFQEIQKQMRTAMSGLDKGNISETVKLFDKKLDYFIYGYIDNLTITHRESLGGSNLTVRVDLTVRIVDASTGKIVCVATGKGESASHGESNRKSFKMGGEEVDVFCWDDALRKSLNQILKTIQKQL